MSGRNHRAGIAVLLAATALAGCGGGGDSDEDQVRDVVNSFVEAGRERDAAAACELLAADQVKTVEGLGSGGCAAVLGGIFAKSEDVETDVDIQDVRVEGNRATVDATVKAPGVEPRTQTILLVKEDGEWKLASAGL